MLSAFLKKGLKISKKPLVKRSSLFVPVQKESSSDPNIVASHQLMVQNGLISQVSSGIYTFMPIAQRALDKINTLIDEEMHRVGGQKVTMPSLVPATLWKTSGRLKTTGPELFRLKDRKEIQYVLGPTHEEVVTDLVKNTLVSYKQLPLKIYQTTWKFRDEARPRFGLLRCKEFLMKDMYSFDLTQQQAYDSYDQVRSAYKAIFDRLSVPYVIAEADSGNIGGNKSEEFHLISDIGEDKLTSCGKCGYAANVEKAKGVLTSHDFVSKKSNPPSTTESNEIKKPFNSNANVLRSVIFGITYADPQQAKETNKPTHAAVILRNDRNANQFFLKDVLGALEVNLIGEMRISNDGKVPPLADAWVFLDESAFCNQSWPVIKGQVEKIHKFSDLPAESFSQAMTNLFESNLEVKIGNFRTAEHNDKCPNCSSGTLKSSKGIEVGHVFYLGTKYSKPFELEINTDNSAADKQLLEMGCYGIGVSRVLAAVLQSTHDKFGLVWPKEIAPYKAAILPLGSQVQMDSLVPEIEMLMESLVKELGWQPDDVVIDDRQDYPGPKMNEARAFGYPWVIVLGSKFKETGKFEIQERKSGKKHFCTIPELIELLKN